MRHPPAWLLVAVLVGALHAAAATPATIDTIAGGGTRTDAPAQEGVPATALSLRALTAMALDGDGHLYLWDDRHGLLRVDARSGTASTVLNEGALGDEQVSALAIDTAGLVYIALGTSSRVIRLEPATGRLIVIAGDGTPGFAGDGGPAVAARLQAPCRLVLDTRGGLLVVDREAHRIRRVDLATRTIETVAGTGRAGFRGDGGVASRADLDEPVDVAVDAAGNAWIAEYANNRVRRIDATTGVITTVAGNGTRTLGLDGAQATASAMTPIAVAIDPAGALVVADGLGNRVRRIDPATGTVTSIVGRVSLIGFGGDGGPATDAQLSLPKGIAYDRAGNLFVFDRLNSRIRKVVFAREP